MKKFASFICENKVIILIVTGILFVLSLVGYKLTEVNYDILVYLPTDIDTVKGQNILADEFDMGAYTVVVTENMSSKEILKLEEEYLKVEGVNRVVSAYDLLGNDLPVDMLPNEVVSRIHDENSDLLFVTFNDSTSSTSTINAINKMRDISKNKALISGMSSMVVDTMNLSSSEITIYIIIAVVLCLIVLELFLDSYLVPFLLLANIGIAIIFNLGSNIIFGSISYITKALVAVLQLGVTTDFSIFLYHAYENEKQKGICSVDAMKEAIVKTFKSVVGSSATTIVGFLVLCTMELTIGKDLGLVMAKGVLLGVICVLTVFPSLILFFDNWLKKTRHKSLRLNFEWLNKRVIKYHRAIFIIFLILLIPFYLASSKVSVYYKIDKSLPDTLESIVANNEISDKFNIVSPEIILLPKKMKIDEEINLVNDLKKVDGIDIVLSSSSLTNMGITSDMLPKEMKDVLESDNYRIMFINSTYEVASDEINNQVEKIDNILARYDIDTILAGEGALMKDLVSISDKDFNNVNSYSIIFILIVMLFVLKSVTLPFLLVVIIEFAIFMNMGISYFSGLTLPFVAPIVLGTIQLGATIDYAILLTTSYLHSRQKGSTKEEAMLKATNYCSTSIFISGLCFFAATFGVGVYSDLEMIGSLCTLISRGAILSMIVVIMVLPSILLIFDKVIMKTMIKGKEEKKMNKSNLKKQTKKVVLGAVAIALLLDPIKTFAISKEETVYSNLASDGKINSTIVNNHLINSDGFANIEDYSDLKDIINLGGTEKFNYSDNSLNWDAKGKNIIYKGTSDKELPIEEIITYKLNDQDISLKDLIGKSGKVEITIEYKNKDSKYVLINGSNELMYTPFVITTALTIDSSGNNNISVMNGKVKETGSKYAVVGLSAPGLYESLKLDSFKTLDTVKISYDTKKFELSNIYSVAVPKLIDSSDLNVFTKLDNLYSEIDSLQLNMNELETSSNKIASSVNIINDGYLKVTDNLNLILTKISEMKEGSVKIDEGLQIVLSKLNELKTSMNSEDNLNKIKEINELLEQDRVTVKKLQSNDYLLKDNYEKYNLINITYDELLSSTIDNKMSLYNIKYNYENLYEINENQIVLLTYNINALEQLLATINDTSENINSMISALSEMSKGATTLNNGISQLEKGLTELTSKELLLSNGLYDLTVGIKEFDLGVNTFNKAGINKISNMASNANGITTRIKALTEFANHYKTFSLTNNSFESSTKFIFVVDSVKVKENKAVKKETTKTSFLDKLVNLFK